MSTPKTKHQDSVLEDLPYEAEERNMYCAEPAESSIGPQATDAAIVEEREQPKSRWESRMQRVNPILSMVFGWTAALLLTLFLGFIVFGILYSGIHYHGEGWHDDVSVPECTTPFGTMIGVHDGVFAYSNCNGSFVTDEWNTIMDGKSNKSGLKWQCVEYARRYWMLRGTPVGAAFPFVDGAADIWSLTSVQLLNGSTAPLLKYANGAPADTGGSAPRVGDLLIYPKQRSDFPFGHVAVIVDVTSSSVLVAEQNWENTVWPAPYHNYSREIPMRHDGDAKTYTISEEDNIEITGWVRYG